MAVLNALTPQEITRRLSFPRPITPPWFVPPLDRLRKAAVLIPFQCIREEWFILFTRRTDTVQDHKGQVSFPGGARDPQDFDETATALREAQEEIALLPGDVTVLGRMGEIGTMTGYLITPVVASIPYPYRFEPSPNEVARIFTIPLAWLDDPAHHYENLRTLPDGSTAPVIYFQEFDGEMLWGITAFITLAFLELLHET